MHALILQHSAQENAGTLLDWLRARGHTATVHHWYAANAAPAPAAYDCLVVLGGTMNLDEEQQHSWLKPEKAFVREWLTSKKPTLGICLGGQMLAEALGGTVKKAPEREIGFQLVNKTGSHPALERWPASMAVYQFHGDAFSLPPGCQSLASSPACAHQAFARGRQVLALQFHPESTAAWIEKNASQIEKQEGETFVQTPAETAGLVSTMLPPLTDCFFRLLDDFFAA
jgi:GMP synthase-like glutamine amidotransferase